MIAKKSCKILTGALLILTLLATTVHAQYPPYQFNRDIRILSPGNQCNPQMGSRCGPGGCPPQPRTSRPLVPIQRATEPAQPVRPKINHPSVVQTESKLGDRAKQGHGTYIVYGGKFYIVTCAHVLGSGWQHFVNLNNKLIEMELLHVWQLDDLAILAVRQLPMRPMPLAPTFASVGERVTVAGRSGLVLGYRAKELLVKVQVQDGESGGPIHSAKGLVGVIASYEYPTGTDPTNGITSGPNVTLISDFLSKLASPPVPVPIPPVPVPVEPEEPEVPEAPTVCLDKPCRDSVEINKKDIGLNKRRMDDIESALKEAALSIQRLSGAAEILHKEVISQKARLDVLEQKGKDSVLRIQRLEAASTKVTTTEISTQPTRGTVQFRMRLDQSGRVIGVEPR